MTVNVWAGLIVVAAAVALDYALMLWARRQVAARGLMPRVKIFGRHSDLLTWAWYELRTLASGKLSLVPGDVLELVLVVLWALWLTAPYLDFDRTLWPIGSDFPRNVQLFSTWQNLARCGLCVLWNGGINGGAPAFADIFTPVLNPLFIAATLGGGVISGSKILLAGSFIVAGLAQLWLGRVLGLGRPARLWAALMAVAGGHLTGRMQMGHIVMIVPIAFGSLTLAPAFDLARTGRRRSAVWLGLTMALALVSGHGYIQIAILFGVLPALLLYWFDARLRLRPVWSSFLWAALLTVLLTGVFWLPLVHFWPNVAKDGNPYFSGGQPIPYALINLFVQDRRYFFEVETLNKGLFPAFYMMYITGLPLVLGLFALRLVPRRENRTLAVLVLAICLVYLTSSGDIFKNLPESLQGFFNIGRNISLLVPIAVPLLLAVGAWGLDELLKLNWPRLALTWAGGSTLPISLALLLLAPVGYSLLDLSGFGRQWIATQTFTDQQYPIPPAGPDGVQWIAPVFGDFQFFPKAIEANAKISIPRDFAAWNWQNRNAPPARIEMTRDLKYQSSPNFQRLQDGIVYLEYPDRHYAAVTLPDGTVVPCHAAAQGGDIDVTCTTDQPGRLRVFENNWTGWTAAQDGQAIPFDTASDWLETGAPAGTHTYQFRYRPWDVWAGALLTVAGVFLAVRMWRGGLPGLPAADPLDELASAHDPR